MKVGDREFYELIAMFDKEFKGYRIDKESRDYWRSGNVYQSGETNSLFIAYRKGYLFAKANA